MGRVAQCKQSAAETKAHVRNFLIQNYFRCASLQVFALLQLLSLAAEKTTNLGVSKKVARP